MCLTTSPGEVFCWSGLHTLVLWVLLLYWCAWAATAFRRSYASAVGRWRLVASLVGGSVREVLEQDASRVHLDVVYLTCQRAGLLGGLASGWLSTLGVPFGDQTT